MVICEINGHSFSISKPLTKYWDKYSLKMMKKINRDKLDLVDGSEGTGKSMWCIQQFAYIEPEAFETPEKFVSRIAFTPDEFLKMVRETKNGVVIFDEAFRGFSSRSALSKINKLLVQSLMEMRQNNNIVFIVLPSFYLLDIYPAMLRSNSLFNIYIEKGSGRRVWQGFNKKHKNSMYQKGVKKGWGYPIKSKVRGNFFGKFPGGPEYEKAYLDKKEKSFREDLKNMNKVTSGTKPIGFDPMTLKILAKMRNDGEKWMDLQKFMESCEINVSHETIRTHLKKFMEEGAKKPEN